MLRTVKAAGYAPEKTKLEKIKHEVYFPTYNKDIRFFWLASFIARYNCKLIQFFFQIMKSYNFLIFAPEESGQWNDRKTATAF